MFILDTDILSEFFSGNATVANRVQNATRTVVTTVITEGEILRGRIEYLLKADSSTRLLQAQTLFQKAKRQLADFLILEMNSESLEHFQRNIKLRVRGRASSGRQMP